MIDSKYSLLHSAVVCAALLLGGCASMAPDYQRPDTPVPAHWLAQPMAQKTAQPSQLSDVNDTADATATSSALPLNAWRSVFTDARLQHTLESALANNRDLRVALLNIDKTRALYRIQQAEQSPTVQASGGQSASHTAAGVTARSYTAQVGVSSWELDVFGRVQSLSDQALYTYLASAQTQQSTRLSLLAEVAGQWLTFAANQQQLALAERTLHSQQETLALTRLRYQEGVVSGGDVSSVQASVERARVDVARYDTSLAQARNALDLLVGASLPPEWLPQPGDDMASLVALAPVPADLSSSVLLQRPDVLAAERLLQAANANIGAARAAFFPTMSLTASAGLGSDSLSGLFDGARGIWSFVPQISVPIFNAGALKAQLDVAELSRDITVAEYEKAIQTAFKEVADALAERGRIGQRLSAQQALVAATERSHTLADARWRQGIDSALEAQIAQRNLYSAQQDAIALALTEATNRITLFKVLAGEGQAE